MEEAFESFKEKCLKSFHAREGEVYNGKRYTAGEPCHVLRKRLLVCWSVFILFSPTDLDGFTSRMSERLSGMLNNTRFDALDREDKTMYVKANGMIKDLVTATDAYCSDDTQFCIERSIKSKCCITCGVWCINGNKSKKRVVLLKQVMKQVIKSIGV